jgi:hypothetical protein
VQNSRVLTWSLIAIVPQYFTLTLRVSVLALCSVRYCHNFSIYAFFAIIHQKKWFKKKKVPVNSCPRPGCTRKFPDKTPNVWGHSASKMLAKGKNEIHCFHFLV